MSPAFPSSKPKKSALYCKLDDIKKNLDGLVTSQPMQDGCELKLCYAKKNNSHTGSFNVEEEQHEAEPAPARTCGRALAP